MSSKAYSKLTVTDSNNKTSRKIAGYCRVSTRQQGNSGNGLEAQKRAIENYAAKISADILDVYVEVESGRKSARPELIKAMQQCEETDIILVVAKLDRLTRNVGFLSMFTDRNINFVALDMPNMSDPNVAKLTMNIMASVAEFEAKRISDRVREGLKSVKLKGKKLGSPNPEIGAAVGGQATAEQANKNAQRVYPFIQKFQRFGIKTYGAIARELNEFRVPLRVANDGSQVIPGVNKKWRAQQVKNIMNRFEQLAV